MPGVDGYIGTPAWDVRQLLDGMFLDGVALLDTAGHWPASWTPGTAGTHLPTMDGGAVVQYQWIGGDAPLMARPLEISLTLQHNIEADYFRMLAAEAAGPRRFWFGLWLTCMWYIPGRNTGQTAWKTDRRFPYSLTGITHSSHPPQVLIDGTAQSIITTGTPTTGQAKVPTTGGFGAITLPAGITGEYLELRCPFELLVTVQGPSTSNPQANLLPYSATLREVQGSGDYTGATD